MASSSTTTAGASGRYSVTTSTLADGQYTVMASAVDRLGKPSSALTVLYPTANGGPLTVDTQGPKVTSARFDVRTGKATIEITDEAFTFTRNTEAIAAEAALDGIYVLRTSLPTDTLTESEVVARYKNLADVERFFRTLNTELDIRPIRHRLADRVRAHVFLRMLSYYISWHMKAALAPILFVDNDKPAAAAKRADPVAAAQRSDEALAKAARKRTQDDYPVHSFTSLLADLATICANHIQPADDTPAFTMITSPTPLQRQAFDLLGLSHRHGYA